MPRRNYEARREEREKKAHRQSGGGGNNQPINPTGQVNNDSNRSVYFFHTYRVPTYFYTVPHSLSLSHAQGERGQDKKKARVSEKNGVGECSTEYGRIVARDGSVSEPWCYGCRLRGVISSVSLRRLRHLEKALARVRQPVLPCSPPSSAPHLTSCRMSMRSR